MFAPDEINNESEVKCELPLKQSQKKLAEVPVEDMASHPKRRAVYRNVESASSILANLAGMSGLKHESHLNQIPEISDDEHSAAGGPGSFGERRKKRLLNRRAALQFIDSMVAVEGESKCDGVKRRKMISASHRMIALSLEMIYSTELIYFTLLLFILKYKREFYLIITFPQ